MSVHRICTIVFDGKTHVALPPINVITEAPGRYHVVTPAGYMIRDALNSPRDTDYEQDFANTIADGYARLISQNMATGIWRDITGDSLAVSLISAAQGTSGELLRLARTKRDIFLAETNWKHTIPIAEEYRAMSRSSHDPNPRPIIGYLLKVPGAIRHPVYELSTMLNSLNEIHKRGIIYGRPWITYNGHLDVFRAEYVAAFDSREVIWEIINELDGDTKAAALQYLPKGADELFTHYSGGKSAPRTKNNKINKAKALSPAANYSSSRKSRGDKVQGDFLSLLKIASLYDISRALDIARVDLKVTVGPNLVSSANWPIDEVLVAFHNEYEH